MSWVATIGVVTTVGGAIIGNQERQKAKGEAGAIERQSAADQAAADAKLKFEHDQDIRAQSQAGAIARAAMSQPLAPTSTLLIHPGGAPPGQPSGFQPLPSGPRKMLLGD